MNERRPGGTLPLAACFFLSGLGSLVLEVVWTRKLRLVFGSTTLAASTILVAYMLGLGLGGLAGGRLGARLRHGVRAYGWLEVAIGVYALAVPCVLGVFPVLNRAWLYTLPFWPAALVRFALALLVLLLPTLLMGATLPVLVATLARDRAGAGGQIGLFYGVNTLGAVTGVFLATFVLFPAIGLGGANATGALVDIAVGVVTLTVLARRWPATEPAAPPATASPAPALGAWAPPLAAYAVVGFTALVYEVAWTRALSMVLGSSLYAFSAMLGAFLTGIALGSLMARRVIDRLARPLVAFAVGIAALGVLGLGTTLLLPLLPHVFLRLVVWFGITSARTILFQVGLAMLAMLPPTLVLGALFPLLVRGLASRGREAGAATGAVYFANTVGSATGAFAAGFFLIPALGLRGTLALAAAINLLSAGALALAVPDVAPRRRLPAAALAAAGAVALLLVPLPWNLHDLTRGVFRHPLQRIEAGIELLPLEGVPNDELVYYRDGLNATVSVHRDAEATYLKVNGKTDASSPGDMPTQVLSAHIPLLFGPPASRVLVIGLASGITLGSVVRHPVERADAVEIEPAIAEASRFFDPWSGAPLDDPRVRLIVDDGRTYLSGTQERYDVIISEPSNPWISGVSNLFTREFFAGARRALAPGGRLLQWVQLYGLDSTGLRSVLAAVRSEFPYVYVFAYRISFGDLLLLASLEPLGRERLPRWEQLSPAVQDDLARVDILSTEDLWTLLRLLPADIDALARDAPVVNSDENLFVELNSPLLLHQEHVTLGKNQAMVQQFPFGIYPLLRDGGAPVDPEQLGALALSYAQARDDYEVGKTLGQLAVRARSAHAIAAAVALAMRDKPASVLLPSLDPAVAAAPDAADMRLLRARLRLAAERWADALEDADAAQRLRPDDPRARVLRWQALYRLGRLEEAESELDATAKSSYFAFQPKLWRDAADVWLARGRFDEAIDALTRYLAGDRFWSEGWEKLADAYARSGRAADAERAKRNAATARRDRLLLTHREARLAAWRGDRQKAIALLERATTQDPTYEPARADLAEMRRGG